MAKSAFETWFAKAVEYEGKVNEEVGLKLDGVTLEKLGSAERVLVDNGPDKFVFSIGKSGILWKLDRRNGKFLYISDLVNWREYAYTLFREPLGDRVPVTETLRRAGQADIRIKMDEVDALFRAK